MTVSLLESKYDTNSKHFGAKIVGKAKGAMLVTCVAVFSRRPYAWLTSPPPPNT